MRSSYEGHVRRADDSIISAQCDRDRHGKCPDDVPADEVIDGQGPLSGYYCECDCHTPAGPAMSTPNRHGVYLGEDYVSLPSGSHDGED